MSELSVFPYHFNPSDTGIFAEIHLPKKARYQGILYRVLEEGFEFCGVQEHLVKKEKEIKELLKNYREVCNYTPERIEEMEPVFFGYSMYEADGVFLDREEVLARMAVWKTQAKSERKYMDLIFEERTQVIRFMFRPNLSQLYKSLGVVDTEPFSEKFYDLKKFAREFLQGLIDKKDVDKGQDEDRKRIAEYLSKWEDDAALFLFGYVVYCICERIEQLQEAHGQKPEQEIWVTSFWNLILNRVTRDT